MDLLRFWSARRLIVACAVILGLINHMAWDAVPALAFGTDNSGRTLTLQQRQFFAALRKARAQALMAGVGTFISVDEFSKYYQANLHPNDARDDAQGLRGSDKKSRDLTVDDCPGCLNNNDSLKVLENMPDFEQFIRAIAQIVYLSQFSDPKWSRQHILFLSRAPPRHA